MHWISRMVCEDICSLISFQKVVGSPVVTPMGLRRPMSIGGHVRSRSIWNSVVRDLPEVVWVAGKHHSNREVVPWLCITAAAVQSVSDNSHWMPFVAALKRRGGH